MDLLCYKCKKEFPESNFHRAKRYPKRNYKAYYCKKCAGEYKKASKAKKPLQYKEASRLYTQKTLKHKVEYCRSYRKANPEWWKKTYTNQWIKDKSDPVRHQEVLERLRRLTKKYRKNPAWKQKKHVRSARARKELQSHYIKHLINTVSGLKAKDIPVELVEAKRELLSLKRNLYSKL